MDQWLEVHGYGSAITEWADTIIMAMFMNSTFSVMYARDRKDQQFFFSRSDFVCSINMRPSNFSSVGRFEKLGGCVKQDC